MLYDVILLEPSMSFYVSCDLWPYDLVTLIMVLRIEREVIWKEKEKENKNEKEMKII